MKIEKIKIKDFNEIYNLWIDSGILLAPIEQEKFEFEMMLKMNPATSLCIKDKGKIIGAGIGASNGRRAFIYHLAISPDYQKQGLGSLLLNEIEKGLIELKVSKIELEVFIWKSYNVGFYQKHGFRVNNKSIHLEKQLLV
jgi:N-acetylglutamate synthase